MKPEPVPCTFAFSSSASRVSEVLLGILANSRSLMNTTEDEVPYKLYNNLVSIRTILGNLDNHKELENEIPVEFLLSGTGK